MTTLASQWLGLVQQYKGKSWRPFRLEFDWNQDIIDFIKEHNPTRCQRRLDKYVIPGEIERANCSLRFGHVKTGYGLRGEVKDFCLLAGVIEKKRLTVFYRRLELISGFHYDLAVYDRVRELKGPIKSVTVIAIQADIYAAEGNSNQKLFPLLTSHYRTQIE